MGLVTRDPDQPPECLRAEARVEATASKWKGSGYAHRGRKLQTKRGSTCSEAQILRKQIPQHLPWGQSTGALNAEALLLRRRRWAAAPVSGTRVKKQEGNSGQRNREGPKDTGSGRPGTASTNTPAGGPVPLSFSFLKQKNGTNATSLTDGSCGH